MPENVRTSYEYKNEFMSFVITPDHSGGGVAWRYCSGVNLQRFLPITKGRHGLGSNPAMRGLQIVKCGVRDIVLSKGATSKSVRGINCPGIASTKDTWYTEFLLIENAPASLPEEIITFCAPDLLRSIFKACMLELQLPEKLPSAGELQVFIEGLVDKYGR